MTSSPTARCNSATFVGAERCSPAALHRGTQRGHHTAEATTATEQHGLKLQRHHQPRRRPRPRQPPNITPPICSGTNTTSSPPAENRLQQIRKGRGGGLGPIQRTTMGFFFFEKRLRGNFTAGRLDLYCNQTMAWLDVTSGSVHRPG